MTFTDIKSRVAITGLSVVGAFHPTDADGTPEGISTLLLLGATGPEMWNTFQRSPEAVDGGAHPMDRWSQRVTEALSGELGATALFPFSGPPWQPFQNWAAKGEGAVTSPVAMQATSARGLWTSYRAALGFVETFELPAPDLSAPCTGCDAPCLTACPVGAFANGSYDVPKCVRHLKSGAGEACLQGCLVRSACPYSQAINLPLAQRSFHIQAFLGSNG